ncbi:MAG: hypothetical protein PHE53_13315 [Thermoguttaceae bacterium]|nr:hypothetical protein [Thermoguttaceae bacterium]
MNSDISHTLEHPADLQRAIRERIPLKGNLWQGVPAMESGNTALTSDTPGISDASDMSGASCISQKSHMLGWNFFHFFRPFSESSGEESTAILNDNPDDKAHTPQPYSKICPTPIRDEWCETFLSGGKMDGTWRFERIVSFGNASPPDFWYDQEEHEWVVLLAGSAVLRFDTPDVSHGEPSRVVPSEACPVMVEEKKHGWCQTIQPGDWLWIPAHVRHRIESTSADIPTFWLAFFCRTTESN